jgi:hypothetical protein
VLISTHKCLTSCSVFTCTVYHIQMLCVHMYLISSCSVLTFISYLEALCTFASQPGALVSSCYVFACISFPDALCSLASHTQMLCAHLYLISRCSVFTCISYTDVLCPLLSHIHRCSLSTCVSYPDTLCSLVSNIQLLCVHMYLPPSCSVLTCI